jgi:hypothetical protein
MADLHLEQKDGYVMGRELDEIDLINTYEELYGRSSLSMDNYKACIDYLNYDYASQYRVPQSAAEAVRKGFDHSKTTEGVEYWKGVMDELEEA